LYRVGFHAKFEWRKNRHLGKLAGQIIAGKFSDVLLVDAEVCDAEFVKQLMSAGIRVHLYKWDSTKNKPRCLTYLELLHAKCSFDPQDCSTYGLSYVPLFAEDVFSARLKGQVEPPDRPIDVSFCGTLHSNRARRLAHLMKVAGHKGLKVCLLLYFHSRWLLLIKSAVHISNLRFIHQVSTTGFSKQEIFDVFARSRFVFDLPHPGQLGLTARTFEALRSGTRLITFNRLASSLLPPSFADRVFVINTADDIRGLDFSGPCPTSRLSAQDDYYLSLDRFVDQLLGAIEKSASKPGSVPEGADSAQKTVGQLDYRGR
jgi:hypothetical protein